jgi:hypothetical protein
MLFYWTLFLVSLNFILSYEVGFYKPTVNKVHPPFCGITIPETMPVGALHLLFLLHALIQINSADLKSILAETV